MPAAWPTEPAHRFRLSSGSTASRCRPETEPLHPSRRAVQLDWRLRELEDLRAERRRLELIDRLRRALTLGLLRR